MERSKIFNSTMNDLTKGNTTDRLTTFFYEKSNIQLQITDEAYNNSSTVIFLDKERAKDLINELQIFINQ